MTSSRGEQAGQCPGTPGGPHSPGCPAAGAGNLTGPLEIRSIKGCGMTLPLPKISPRADSGKVDV